MPDAEKTKTPVSEQRAPEADINFSEVKRTDLFKYLFFNKFGTMVFLNILTVLFAIPLAIVVIMFYLNSSIALGLVPYSANIGIGYPVTIDAAAIGFMTAYYYQIVEFSLLVPCIAFFAVGVSGNLYVMRRLVTGAKARTFRDFFVGIKHGWLHAIITGIIVGAAILYVVFSLGYFDAFGLSVAYKAVSLTASILILVVIILFAAFFMTQAVTVKQSIGKSLGMSLKLIVRENITALAMVGLAVAPIFLIFIPGILMLFIMIYFMLGISYTTLVITLYASTCYRSIPPELQIQPSVKAADKKADKTGAKTNKPERPDNKSVQSPSETEAMSVSDNAVPPEKRAAKKPIQQQYKNPKKGKRSDKPTVND